MSIVDDFKVRASEELTKLNAAHAEWTNKVAECRAEIDKINAILDAAEGTLTRNRTPKVRARRGSLKPRVIAAIEAMNGEPFEIAALVASLGINEQAVYATVRSLGCEKLGRGRYRVCQPAPVA